MKRPLLIGLIGIGIIFLMVGLRTMVVRGSEREDLKIAITFDDGPHPYYTEQLLDGLKERNVKATFFVLGENVEAYPELVQRMQEEGHLIGNHTYSHLQLTECNEDEFIRELEITNDLIEEITGEPVGFCRPPYGAWNRKYEKELEMLPVLWNIDPLDWSCQCCDTIVNRVLCKCHPNGIILLHDGYKTSVTAALEIIDQLQAKGYRFVTVEEIIMVE